MPWIRNTSGEELRGYARTLAPDDTEDVPDAWLRRRRDRIRRGQFAIIAEPAAQSSDLRKKTNAELRALLSDAGVEAPKRATKAELIQLLQEQR